MIRTAVGLPESPYFLLRSPKEDSNLEAESVESSGFVAGDDDETTGFEFKHRFYTSEIHAWFPLTHAT